MSGIRCRARAVTLASILLICVQLAVRPAHARDESPCTTGLLPGGAQYTIVAPQGWTPAAGELLILAPGYTFPGEQAEVPTVDEDVFLTLSAFGFAVAGVTYRKSGLAVKQGAEDLEELLAFFTGDPLQCGYGRANRIWLIGGSEGGLIAALVGERHAQRPDPLVDGVLAGCAPVGDFRRQLDYIIDFRVVFDALFPGVIPGSALDVPPEVGAEWDTVHVPRIRELIAADPARVEGLLRITGAAYVPEDPSTIEETVLALLEYGVRATNDALFTLGGSPYDNLARVYAGSGDPALDVAVNAAVVRHAADPIALAELEAFYTTNGNVARADEGGSDVPVVLLHTESDPIVPFWHAQQYQEKVLAAGAQEKHASFPVARYGHCTFDPMEVFTALFTLMMLR
ncbi:MAG: hypothetical protein DIU56_012860 [Pseudomonadota bacterium]